MKTYNIILGSVCMGLCSFAAYTYFFNPFSTTTVIEESKMAAVHLLNSGAQADNKVKFLSRGQGYSLFFTPHEIIYALQKGTGSNSHVHFFRFQFIGAETHPEMKGLEQEMSKVTYSLEKEKETFPNFRKVAYENLYEGVNAIFYANQEQLGYEFSVEPKVNLNNIRWHMEGVDKLSIDSKGNLWIGVKEEKVMMHKPIDGKFVLLGDNNVGFAMNHHDTTKPLVIK